MRGCSLKRSWDNEIRTEPLQQSRSVEREWIGPEALTQSDLRAEGSEGGEIVDPRVQQGSHITTSLSQQADKRWEGARRGGGQVGFATLHTGGVRGNTTQLSATLATTERYNYHFCEELSSMEITYQDLGQQNQPLTKTTKCYGKPHNLHQLFTHSNII